MATKILGRGEGLLRMSLIETPNVVLVRTAIETNGVDDRLKKIAMKGLVNLTDAERIVTPPTMTDPVINACLKVLQLPRCCPQLLLLRRELWRQAIPPVARKRNQLLHVIVIGSGTPLPKGARTRVNNHSQS
jgi:hypothetical protein